MKAAFKFSLVINPKSHPVKNVSIGELLSHPPTINMPKIGNGACLFNSFSILLCGRDTYSAIIRHVLCNYISNPLKYNILQPYIPEVFKSGKEYITKQSM